MERDHFKERLPQINRSGLANWFLYPIRGGIHDPRQIVDTVLAYCHEKIRWHPAPLIAELINLHREEAESYAALMVEQETLPKPKRYSERARRNRMRKLPSSATQNAALIKLGHGPASNRLDAHDKFAKISASRSLPEVAKAFWVDENE